MSSSLYLLFLVELLIIVVYDLKERKIRNLWSVFHLFLCPLLYLVFEKAYLFNFEMLILPLVILIVGFVLFALKIAGGGDVKFLSSFFLLIPLHFQKEFLSAVLIVTVFVALFFIVYNLIRSHKVVWLGIRTFNFAIIKEAFGSRFPYSVVIFISWVYFGWSEKLINF